MAVSSKVVLVICENFSRSEQVVTSDAAISLFGTVVPVHPATSTIKRTSPEIITLCLFILNTVEQSECRIIIYSADCGFIVKPEKNSDIPFAFLQ